MKTIHNALTAVIAIVVALFFATSVGAATVSPPGATTGAVVSVKPTSALVEATVDPNGSSTNWQFEYGFASSSSYTNATPMKSAGSGAKSLTVSSDLSGLSPATSYHYRIVASNAGGTTYGTQGLFNTTTPPSVLTEAASKVVDTTAVLNGIVNPEGPQTYWYFEYGTTPGFGSRTATQTIPAGSSNVNVASTLSGLVPAATYYFRLVAISSSGSAHGVPFSFKTSQPVTITASTTSTVFGGTTVLSGNVVSGASGVAVTVEYEQFNQGAFTGVAVVTSGTGGAWTYTATPVVRTSYEATVGGVASSPVVVGVRPLITLSKSPSGVLTSKVAGASSFADDVLQLQRFSGGNWVTWKHVRLNAKATVRFTTSLPKGRTDIRMAMGPFVIGPDQAGPGYLAGFSRVIGYVKS